MIDVWNTRHTTNFYDDLSPAQRKLLERFFANMCTEMIGNNNKGDFVEDWQPDLYEMLAETAYHMAKLNKAMIEVDRGKQANARHDVNEFSADIANYMAKITQMLGTALPKKYPTNNTQSVQHIIKK
jgi:hypothetical protein